MFHLTAPRLRGLAKIQYSNPLPIPPCLPIATRSTAPKSCYASLETDPYLPAGFLAPLRPEHVREEARRGTSGLVWA